MVKRTNHAPNHEAVSAVPVQRIKENPWASEVGPPLSPEDYELLKLSIKEEGIQIPLVVWQRGKNLIVLSGSNRLRIARQLKLKTVPAIIRQFPDETAAKLFALTDNLARRHLTTGQRAYLAFHYQQLLTVGSGTRTDRQPLSKPKNTRAGASSRIEPTTLAGARQ